MGRSIVTVFLILVILVSASPQARAKIGETWQNVRPVVVESMDSVYSAIRSVVAGNETHNRTKDSPVTPSVNFNVIVT